MNTENLPVPISQIPELGKSMGKENLNLLLKLLLAQEANSHELKMSESKERILDKKLKLATVMRSTIQEYADSCSDNKYAPMAVSSISSSFAAMTGDSQEVKPLDLSIFDDGSAKKKQQKQQVEELKTSTLPLDQRIKDAMEQGFRWNDHNVMPTNESTVLRKIGQWESGVQSGQGCDLADIFSREYDKLLKDYGKAFLVGACMAAEADLSISDQLSPYLKRRFNTLKEIYQGREAASQVVNVEPVVQETPPADPLVLLEALYRHIFQENATDEHWAAKKDHMLRLYENRGRDIHKMDGATLGRLVDLGVCPATIVWRSEEEKRRFLNLQPGMWLREQREHYSPQMESLRDEFINLWRRDQNRKIS
jgi:hypothetical protein